MQIIQGVSLLELAAHEDDCGSLVALEEKGGLPFAPRRVFFITVPDSQTIRGQHASTSEELIVVLSGAATVDLDNGVRQFSLRMAERTRALWVRPGVWLRLKEFEPGTILLVVASQLYSETRHFDSPQLFADLSGQA